MALLLLAIPVSPWELDELLFLEALREYNPIAHHPPPPGYPLFILFGQLVRGVMASDFATLVAISVAASAIGFVMLALAFRNFSGDDATGVIGALLFYWSPAMLIHSTLPISDPGGLALLATALYFGSHAVTGSRGHAGLFALFSALTVGWRMQLAIFVVPMFLAGIWRAGGTPARGGRDARPPLIALVVFTLVCLAWLTPLAMAVGGVTELIDFELGQGKYFAAHDAAESRTGWTPARIAFRFIGRAWGTEPMALVVLALAAIGLVAILRRRLVAVVPLAVGASVYIAVALWVMDPADGVRYALPFVLATAFAAAVGAKTIAGRFAYAIPLLAAIAFLLYVRPLLQQRRILPSPPVQAATFARAILPENAVVLYEQPLAPHAHYYLGDYSPQRIDAGLAKFWNRPDVPLFLYADGATTQQDGHVFRWSASDVYTKLTRNHYRVASIIPLPPSRRFRIVRGVSAQEREPDGLEWRWLDSPAELQLPNGVARDLTLRLGLPPAAPLESNVVTIYVNGAVVTRVPITRDIPASVTFPVPAGSPAIRLEAERTFIPAEVPSMRSGDRRRLAVELQLLETADAVAAAKTPAS